jgi:hypothetical protein
VVWYQLGPVEAAEQHHRVTAAVGREAGKAAADPRAGNSVTVAAPAGM